MGELPGRPATGRAYLHRSGSPVTATEVQGRGDPLDAFSRLGQQSGRWEIWVKDVMSDAGPQFIGFGLFPEWCPVSGTGIAGEQQEKAASPTGSPDQPAKLLMGASEPTAAEYARQRSRAPGTSRCSAAK